MKKIIEMICNTDLQKKCLIKIAFTKASVKIILNLKIYKIKFNEILMKRKIEKYIVLIRYFFFKKKNV